MELTAEAKQKVNKVLEEIAYHKSKIEELEGMLSAFDLIFDNWRNSPEGKIAQELLKAKQNRLIPSLPKIQPEPTRMKQPMSGRKPQTYTHIKEYSKDLTGSEVAWLALSQIEEANVEQLMKEVKRLDPYRFGTKMSKDQLKKMVENAFRRFKTKNLINARKNPDQPKQYIYSIR